MGGVRTLESKVSAPLLARARAGQLDGPDTVRADLERAAAAFASLPEPPPPEVREEARHLEANVTELEHHVFERRREAEEAHAGILERYGIPKDRHL